MSNSCLLNYHFQPARQTAEASPYTLLFIHGLFGDLNNLGGIARAFADHFPILRVDLRNHGQSFHTTEMRFVDMAHDIYRLVQHLGIEKLILIGHSLGGKTAMTFSHHYPELVERLIVIDIAPVAYPPNRHTDVFAGLVAVREAKPATRQQARAIMASQLQDEAVCQFMLKSFDPEAAESFKFHLSALVQNYPHLMDWQPVTVSRPTLFIKAANSDYLDTRYTATTLAQFPQARLHVISNSGHWVHAEKPDTVIQAIQRFLAT